MLEILGCPRETWDTRGTRTPRKVAPRERLPQAKWVIGVSGYQSGGCRALRSFSCPALISGDSGVSLETRGPGSPSGAAVKGAARVPTLLLAGNTFGPFISLFYTLNHYITKLLLFLYHHYFHLQL